MVVTETDWTQVSFEHARTTLRKWRECGVRRSEEAVEMWEHVISRNPAALGDEQWAVLEQICIAALDCCQYDLAQSCIDALDARFPKSTRVLKLHAMKLEATEQFTKAIQLYERLIDSDPTNNALRKRRVAVYITQNKRLEAIKALNEYLKIFLNDAEAWLQLSELFLLENDLAKAAHCLEECVLISPLNSMYLRRLGDIRYSQGGVDNVELAHAYYERALKVNEKDLRAQYGVALANTHISAISKNSSDKKKAMISANTAFDNLIDKYSKISIKVNPAAVEIAGTLEKMKSNVGSK
ncbi:unnamed protein product [Caenorhabditis bovis]|uniref:ER membrane protein complex subunit 2 n=1 Tax=Caenorhabditis bovis TaxID=2654633 RepID=A0A8S1ER65_9PELO|nr:unnamed protein product [Caenorhabditis bovis]